jgi:hypothetical protein
LRHVATIESIGSSTRIEGVKLTDRQIETLRRTQISLNSGQPDWEPWVGFFSSVSEETER